MTATCLTPMSLRKKEANRRNTPMPAPTALAITALLWLLALLPMPGMANTAALSWLNGQLQTDGGYARPDDIATPVQATAETLRTQQALSATNGSLASSLAFLDTAAGQPATEYLSRTLIAHSEAGTPAASVLASLEANQNPDGGFGGAPGQTSDALDTAFALEALAKTSTSHTAVISAAVAYLLSQQNADGSFTQNRYGQGATYTTASALMALHSLRLRYDLAQPIGKATVFLQSAQAGAGGWGSTMDTAWTLLALIPATTDTTPYNNAVQALQNTQLSDGSWAQDVYQTALAARALQAIKNGGGTTSPWNGSVTGHAVDQPSGLPLAGVQVTADSGQSAFTGTDGEFLLTGITPGSHNFGFALAGYAAANRTALVDAGQQAAVGSVGLTVASNAGILSGTVTAAASHQPLAGAAITVNGNNTTLTDAAGAYRLVVPAGSYTVTLTASGFLTATAEATVMAGATLTLSPSLTEASGTPPTTTSLFGTVVDADSGQALSGADVAVSGGTLRTVTDADGSFGLTGLQPGTWELDVSLAGYRSAHITLTAPAGTSDMGMIRLPSLSGTQGEGIVTGSITDAATGNPIANAHLTVTGSADTSAVTNALGGYRIVAPTGNISVTASAPGYRNATGTATLTAGATLTFSPGLLTESATVPTLATLIGSIVDAASNQPLSDVSVVVAGSTVTAVTDGNGQFRLEGLVPGAWILDVNRAGYQGLRLSLTASVGTSDLGTIRLPFATANGNTLAGVVTDSQDGQPLAGAVVAIASEGKRVQTAADGSYRIEGIGANQFSVSISAVGYLSRQGDISLAQAGVSTLNVALERAAGGDIDIRSLVLNHPSFLAHGKIEADIQLANAKSTDRSVRLYGIITTAAGQVIDEFPARIIPLGGNAADALETVPGSGGLATNIDWHNGATAPGGYSLTVQAYDGVTGQLLAERGVPFDILPTRTIGGSVEFDPPIAQLAAQQPVHITAKVSNRGNLDLAGGTATLKVTLKNQGYQTLKMDTLVRGSGSSSDILYSPRAIDRDAQGNFYVISVNGILSKLDPDGNLTEVARGFISPVDLDVMSNGEIVVLSSSSYIEYLRVDGSRSRISTGLSNQRAIEMLGTDHVMIVAGTSGATGVYNLIQGIKTKLPIIGLTNAIEIQSDNHGELFIGDSVNGTIFHLSNSNLLETVQTDLPLLETFAISDNGSIAAVYDTKKLAFFTPNGIRSEISNTLPSTVRGSAWDSNDKIILSVDTTNRLIKMYKSGNGTIGEVVYTNTTTLPPLALNSLAAPLDFGKWTPDISGDFQAELFIDNRSEYGSLSNTLHVGPNAHGDFSVAHPDVHPGDQANQASISLFGADSTSITRIDPSGTALAASSYTAGRGIVADTDGNLYATHNTITSIVKITPDGNLSTFLSGYAFGSGLVIDNKNNLYAIPLIGQAGTVLKITPSAKVTTFAKLGVAIRGIAIGPDELLYVVDANNTLSRIKLDGQVELITKDGISNAKSLTIDGNGYFYILTSNLGQHLDEDGINRNYHKILRISPDGKRYSEYYNQANFEFEGVNVTADCSNNLLFAPILDYPLKLSGEENTLLQLIGDTGETSQVLHGPDYDPAMSDMDVLYYDRFGQRLLIWTDLNNGKIFSFPLVCGGIDADIHLVTRGDVGVSALTPAPSQSNDLGGGRFEHVWKLSQVDNKGAQIQLGLLLKGMAEGESRPIAESAYIEFNNSFVPGQTVRTPLAIPDVLASTAMQLAPKLDASQYGPLSPVHITVDVGNGGVQPFDGELRLSVADADGFPVQDLPNIAINGQAGASTIAYPALWDTGLFLIGGYHLQATLYDTAGRAVADGSVPFAIVQDPQTPALSATLNPDKLIYGGWDSVQLEGLISNTATNALLPLTVVAVSVTAPDGTVVYAGTTDIAELAAGGSLPASFSFALADAASGTYQVAVSVNRAEDNAVLDSFSNTFSVVRTTLQGLGGSVAASPNPVVIGTPVTCAEDLSNQSASGTGALSVSGLLVNLDTDNGTIISQADRTVDLAGGQTDHLDRSIDTANLLPGHYACVLRATVDGIAKDIAAAPFTAVAPQITLNGHVFHDLDHDRLQTADEPGTDAGGLWVTATQGGLAIASAPVQADGSYQLTVPGVAAYRLVLSTAADATGAALPTGWSNTGDIISGVADAVADGGLDVTTHITALTGLDFAIDGAPSVATADRAGIAHALAITLAPLANDLAGPGTTGFIAATLDLDPATATIDTSLSVAGQGVFARQADGSTLFTPDPAFSGLAQASYRVQDSLRQATNTATLTVAVGPAAVADSITTPAGESVSGDVSGNDIAPSGALYALHSPASHGSASVNATGGYTYSPASGYQGTDSFGYQVCLPAPDTTVCATALVSITITPAKATIDLQGTLELGEHGRLLVLVDPLDKECKHDDDDDDDDDDGHHDSGHEEDDDDRHPDDHGHGDGHEGEEDSGHDDDDEHGDGHEGDAACQTQQAERAYLGRVLEAAGWQYAIVDNNDAYTRALRGGAYRLHALLSAQVKLDESVQKELREAVNHGLGLLVGGDHEQRNNVLDNVLGLHYVGHTMAYGLMVPASPGYGAFGKPFAAACKVNRIRPLGSLVLGQFLDAKNKAADCAVTVQTYGRGKAAYLGFDLLAQGALLETAGTGEFSQLLLNLLADVSPAPAYRAGDVVALNLSLHNAGSQPATGWLGLALVGGAGVYDLGGGTAQADGSLRWPFTLAADASLGHQVWTRLPTTGTSVATLDIHADGSTKDPYQSLSLAVPLTDTPTLDFAKAQLLALSKTNKAYLPAYQSVQRAATAIAQGKPDTARAELLKSADALLNIVGNTAATVRQAIDEALRRLGTATG
ncbi:MAG: carboxypeptidase regulatory-like domain-containing protein [Methylovulum miyakonense]|uniref:carboxypeptidase regulatory-like domain-containing protein n=1 Tax=Methylovulum miyakonense TaxID=645578 RepID=UPI003BB51759